MLLLDIWCVILRSFWWLNLSEGQQRRKLEIRELERIPQHPPDTHTHTLTDLCQLHTADGPVTCVNLQLHNSWEKEEALKYCTFSSCPHIFLPIFNMRISAFFFGNRFKKTKNNIKHVVPEKPERRHDGWIFAFSSSCPVSPLASRAGSGPLSAVCSRGGKSSVGRVHLCLLPVQPKVQWQHKVLVQRKDVRTLHHRGENAEEPTE